MALKMETASITVDFIGDTEQTPSDWTEHLNKIGRVFSSVNYGEQTVTTHGTAEALNGGTSLTVPRGAELLIYALDTNTGKIYVGDSGVTSSNGMPLDPKETMNVKINDVSTIYIDSDVDGEGVRWFVESA